MSLESDIKSIVESVGLSLYDAIITSENGETIYRVSIKDKENKGVNVVGVPKTIDNDLNATDVTFGFDTAVNIGPRTAHRIAQEAAGAVADGVLGADSIMALNAQKGSPLLIHALQDRQMAYYNALVARNPHLEEFLVGWRARAYDRI